MGEALRPLLDELAPLAESSSVREFGDPPIPPPSLLERVQVASSCFQGYLSEVSLTSTSHCLTVSFLSHVDVNWFLGGFARGLSPARVNELPEEVKDTAEQLADDNDPTPEGEVEPSGLLLHQP